MPFSPLSPPPSLPPSHPLHTETLKRIDFGTVHSGQRETAVHESDHIDLYFRAQHETGNTLAI